MAQWSARLGCQHRHQEAHNTYLQLLGDPTPLASKRSCTHTILIQKNKNKTQTGAEAEVTAQWWNTWPACERPHVSIPSIT